MADPIDVHKSGLARLHQSEEFSDCKLICGPYHFNLHKVILASHSDYFRTAFKQDTFKEGDTGIIKLRATPGDGATPAEGDDVCDEPEIVKLMVEYFYHFDYLRDTESLPEPSQPSAPTAQPSSHGYIIEHAKVFAIAVKYQIDGLRDLAVSKYKEAVTTCWNHEEFAHSVFVAFNSTAEEATQLRDIVSDTLHQHFDDLKDKAEVETVICNLPRLAYALLKRSRAGGKNVGTDIGEQSGFAVLPEDLSCFSCGTRLASTPIRKMGIRRKGPHLYCYRC